MNIKMKPETIRRRARERKLAVEQRKALLVSRLQDKVRDLQTLAKSA